MKKVKRYWKHFLLWIGAAGMLVGFVGCQQPDVGSAPYVSVETVQMMETASATSEGSIGALAERLNAPKHFEAEALTASDGHLSIMIDAAVEVPDVDAMPIYRVSAGEFDDVFINHAFDYFCGDTPMYDYNNLRDTRDDIQKWIDVLKSDLENNNFPDGDQNVEYWRKVYTKELADYEKRLKYATDDLGAPVQEAIMRTTDLGNGGTVENLHYIDTQTLPSTISFSASGNMKYPFNESRYFADTQTTAAPRSNAELGYYNGANWKQGGRHERYAGAVQPGVAVPEMRFAPEAAMERVSDMLSALGLSEILYPGAISLIAQNGDEQYAYSVDIFRKVNGVPVLSPQYATYVGDSMDGFEWHYETATASVNENGVFYFRWKAPLDIGECTVENANLLSFNEVLDVVKSMLPIVLNPEWEFYWSDYSRAEVHIEKITLSLQRVPDQSSVTSGMLIPVWNFFGKWTNYLPDGSEDTQDSDLLAEVTEQGYSLLSINAIDGSIISKDKGY